jgi:CHAT domain-containing protein
LYDVFIAPVADRLPVAGRVIRLVSDDPVADVPFAALRNRRKQSYLVTRYSFEYMSRLGAPDRTTDQGSPNPKSIRLFVAESSPQIDSSRSLPSLPLAARDAASAAALYPDALSHVDAGADSATVLRDIQRARLFHFSGHAVFDPVDPSRSYLAVPPHGLNASAFGALDLRGLELVVLSACDATRSAHTYAPLYGIADAFLAAGADGVIGPTWRVADDAASAMSGAFYRHYAARASPAEALRSAQLELLSSERPELANPAAWAAFRFITNTMN